MNLKNILSGVTSLALSFLLFSCSSNDDGVKNSNVTLKAINNEDVTGIQVRATDTSTSFSVYSPVTPSVTSSESWVSAEATEPSLMNSISKISLTIEPNTSTQERNAEIIISASGASISVKLTQEAGEEVVEEPEAPTDDLQTLLNIKAIDIAKDIKTGWNIGNTLEATGGETSWGNPKINEEYVKGIKAAGFNAVRIPVSWNLYVKDQETNVIDPSWLDRVNEVVHMVIGNDMYAIVNLHWDNGWMDEHIGNAPDDALVTKYKDIWTQIANRLGHFNERLLFAGLNEPVADNQTMTNSLVAYEQYFIDAIRATGGNNSVRTLIFQGPNTDMDKTYDYMTSFPTDPNGNGYLMAEVHYYSPYNFCLMEEDASWGLVSWFWGEGNHVEGSNRNSTWGEEDYMKAQFDKMKERFVDNGYPVILGEYGAYPNYHLTNLQTEEDKAAILASRAYYYQCVQKFGQERGLLPFVWDTGELINRYNGGISVPEIINSIMESAASSSSPY